MRRSPEGPARTRGLNPSAVSAAVRDAAASRLGRQPTRRQSDRPLPPGPDGPSILPASVAVLWVPGGEQPLTRFRAENEPKLRPHRMLTGGAGATVFEVRKRRPAGSCPELAMLSDYLTQAETGRRPYTADRARADLRGTRLLLVHLGEPGDPLHGEAHPPCRPCLPLLRDFDVEWEREVPEAFRARLAALVPDHTVDVPAPGEALVRG